MQLLLEDAIAATGSILPNGGAAQTARELSATPAACTTPSLSANDNWNSDPSDPNPPTIDTRFIMRQKNTPTAGIPPSLDKLDCSHWRHVCRLHRRYLSTCLISAACRRYRRFRVTIYLPICFSKPSFILGPMLSFIPGVLVLGFWAWSGCGSRRSTKKAKVRAYERI